VRIDPIEYSVGLYQHKGNYAEFERARENFRTMRRHVDRLAIPSPLSTNPRRPKTGAKKAPAGREGLASSQPPTPCRTTEVPTAGPALAEANDIGFGRTPPVRWWFQVLRPHASQSQAVWEHSRK
jgi:hypothetical protein